MPSMILVLNGQTITPTTTKPTKQKWNVTTHIQMGSNFFAALYCSCFEVNTLLALPTKEGGNKGIK